MVTKNTYSTEAVETTAGYMSVENYFKQFIKTLHFLVPMTWKNQTDLKLETFSVLTGIHSPKLPRNMLVSELRMRKLS